MSGKNTPKEPTRRCLKLLEQQEVAVAWGKPRRAPRRTEGCPCFHPDNSTNIPQEQPACIPKLCKTPNPEPISPV